MADKNDILTVHPQETDVQMDLQLRQTKGLADLHEKLVKGSRTMGASGINSDVTEPLSANPDRVICFFQNTGTSPLTLHIGDAVIELWGCTAQNDGTGGFHEEFFWKGAIQVSGADLRYHFSELVKDS